MTFPARVVNHRPAVTAALAYAAGLTLYGRLTGTWILISLCLFCMFFAAAAYRERRALALTAFMLALGIARAHIAAMFDLPRLYAFSDVFDGIRDTLIQRTRSLFGENAGIIGGMLWGDKSGLGADAAAFRDVGIAHIFALSGLHVSFFAGALVLITPKDRPKLRFYLTGAFLLLYCAICGFPSSLVRASVMTLCLLGARLTGRPPDTASSIGFAALIILLVSPAQLHSAGFQMSFAAVSSIAMLYDGLRRALLPLGDTASAAVSVSVSGTLGTLPLIAYYFRRIPLMSLPANLLLLPALPVAVICGFCAVILDFISPVLSYVPALIASFITDVTVSVCRLIAEIPFCAVELPAFSAVACIPYFLALFAVSRYPLICQRAKWLIFAVMLLQCFISALVL